MLGVRADLTKFDTREPRLWTPGLPEVLRPGYRAMFFGPRGTGKSLVAMICVVQVIEAGGSVTYLDLENGERRQAERLAAILAGRAPESTAAVSERLDYRSDVRLGPLSDQTMAEWATFFAGRDLVVIDSLARVLGQLGMNESEAPDFSRFIVRYIDPIAEQGTAVLLLDNTGHDEQNRARGSSTKLDLVELAYKVSSKRIAPDRHGTITLRCVRSRDGDEAESLICGVGDGSYTDLEPDTPTPLRRLLVDAALSVLIAGAHDTPESALSRDGLLAAVRKAGVKGGERKLRELLAEATDDPSTGVRKQGGGGYYACAQPRATGSSRATPTSQGSVYAQPRPEHTESALATEDSPRASSLPMVTPETPWAAGASPTAGGPPVPGALTEAELRQRVLDLAAMSDEDAEREWHKLEASVG
jgi:AAA domain